MLIQVLKVKISLSDATLCQIDEAFRKSIYLYRNHYYHNNNPELKYRDFHLKNIHMNLGKMIINNHKFKP